MKTGNIIIDGIPLSVLIDETEYEIETDFRAMMAIDHIMAGNLSYTEKMIKCLFIFYKGKIPENLKEAVQKMFWFYLRGKDPDEKTDEKRRRKRRRAYSFEIDAPLIFSAFLSEYHIDLFEVKHLHWWKFMAMFEGLSDEHKICRIMYYRTADTSGMTGAQKSHVENMRKMYALKERENEAESTMSDSEKIEKRNEELKDYIAKRQKEINNKAGTETNGE